MWRLVSFRIRFRFRAESTLASSQQNVGEAHAAEPAIVLAALVVITRRWLLAGEAMAATLHDFMSSSSEGATMHRHDEDEHASADQVTTVVREVVAVEARGEVLGLEETINQMITDLRDTTRTNKEQDWRTPPPEHTETRGSP